MGIHAPKMLKLQTQAVWECLESVKKTNLELWGYSVQTILCWRYSRPYKVYYELNIVIINQHKSDPASCTNNEQL